MQITDPKMDRAFSIAQEVRSDYILSIGSNGQGGGKYSVWDQWVQSWARIEVGGSGLEQDIRSCSIDGGALEDMSLTRRGEWFYVYGTLAAAGVPKLYFSKKPPMLSPDLITYVINTGGGVPDNTKMILLILRVGQDGKIGPYFGSDGPRTMIWWPNCGTPIGFSGYDHTLTCTYAPTRDTAGNPAPNTTPAELYLNTQGDLRFHFLIVPSNFPQLELNGHAYNTLDRKRSMLYFALLDENGMPIGPRSNAVAIGGLGGVPLGVHCALKPGVPAGHYSAAPFGWTPDLDSGPSYFALKSEGQFVI